MSAAVQSWASVQLLAAMLWAMWAEYQATRETPYA